MFLKKTDGGHCTCAAARVMLEKSKDRSKVLLKTPASVLSAFWSVSHLLLSDPDYLDLLSFLKEQEMTLWIAGRK